MLSCDYYYYAQKTKTTNKKVIKNVHRSSGRFRSSYLRRGRVVAAKMLSCEAWECAKPGSVDDLKLNKTKMLGQLNRENVRVRVKCVGLNFADVFTVLGLYGATPRGETFVPGLEFSGVVIEGPVAFVGKRVSGVTRFGAFASVVDVPLHQVRVMPDHWSFQEGAAFIVQTLTVYYGLSALGRIKKDDVVLVHSAAGGCGSQALAICEKLGAKAIAVVGDSKKAETVKLLPKSAIIVRDRKNFGEQVKAAASNSYSRENVDVVLDATLGDFFLGGWQNLAKGRGVYVVYGAADMTPRGNVAWYNVFNWVKLAYKYYTRPRVDAMELPGENKTIAGFNLIWMYDKHELLLSLLSELEKMNLPPPMVGLEFDWEDLPHALKTFQSGKTSGKIVINL